MTKLAYINRRRSRLAESCEQRASLPSRLAPPTSVSQSNISLTAQAACLMESEESALGESNDDRLDFEPTDPLSLEQKRQPASSSPEASSRSCSPRQESPGNARPPSYKSSLSSLSIPDGHTRSYLSKGTAPGLVEDWHHPDLNDKFVALDKCLPPLLLEPHQQDQAFLEEALLRSAPQRNPSKTMILKRATDYIAELEQRNQSLSQENKELQSRPTPLITVPHTPSQLHNRQPWLCEESVEGQNKGKEVEVLGLSHTKNDMKDF
ncbi:hypothetical protein B0T10DRAFT_261951 [Thelonectria olida]|uniref:BHLH domain-containing protein n=1 Tax=Thelonectria olida TaxID=1576542 RepID=A0A9P8VSX8_9HYPO|nr:hypothetical protein B0T10DRAFT_261951 [Thelonectria olida]